MMFVRWSAASRTLPAAEVDGVLGEVADRVSMFAFETNRMRVESHGGGLSLKMVVQGEEQYHLQGRTITLTPGRVLLVNAGERYASSIDRPRTRSVSFFLPEADARSALASITLPDEALLDDPHGARLGVAEVTQAPFRIAGSLATLTSRLAHLAFAPTAPSAWVLEPLVVETTIAALDADRRLVRRGAFASVRRGTRAELVARVARARDLIDDTRGRVSLAEMASVACLSRYHFLRAFREATGLTPVAYARRLRLQHGLAELRRTGSARRGARAGGFASVSSFLRAARREPAP